MAKATAAKKVERFNDDEFVQYELSVEQKKDLKARFCKELSFLDLFTKLVETEYKITVKYDGYTGGVQAFLFPIGPTHVNKGRIVSGRGRTVEGALFEASYKHFVVFDCVWPAATKNRQVDFWDDFE